MVASTVDVEQTVFALSAVMVSPVAALVVGAVGVVLLAAAVVRLRRAYRTVRTGPAAGREPATGGPGRLDLSALLGRAGDPPTPAQHRTLTRAALLLPPTAMGAAGIAVTTAGLALAADSTGMFAFQLIFAGYVAVLALVCLVLGRRARQLAAVPVQESDSPAIEIIIDPRRQALGTALIVVGFVLYLGVGVLVALVLLKAIALALGIVAGVLLYLAGSCVLVVGDRFRKQPPRSATS